METPSSDRSLSILYGMQSPLTCAHCRKLLQPPEHLFPYPYCTFCQKVLYCCEAHKKANQSKHENLCFPALIEQSEDRGRYWIASRDIAQDETIFIDKAIVIGPNVPCVSHLYPTCLGCCRGTNTTYRCSKCYWPMCSKRCEKIANHSKYECKVFRKNRVEPSIRPQYYFFVQFLRSLLMREIEPIGFAQLMALEGHINARKKQKEEVFMLKSFYRFLTEECNLDYEYELVDHIVGVNRVNCYSGDGLIHGKKRFCTAVFPTISLINHNCKPNTRTILHEKVTGTLLMELRASSDIRQGEEISQQYISSTKGTLQRRSTLMEDWFFGCTCERCKDPTELATFFSAVKCSNCPGYLLPLDPLVPEAEWKCGMISGELHLIQEGCGYSRSCENIKGLVDEVERKMKEAEYNMKEMDRLLSELLHSLHPNHFLIINIKFGLVDEIVRKINYPVGGSNEGIRYEEVIKAIKYTKDILGVTRVISPASIGVVLYFLASSILELKLRTDKACKFSDAQVKNVVNEAWAILRVEADGSSYREMAKLLEEKSVVMNLEKLSF